MTFIKRVSLTLAYITTSGLCRLKEILGEIENAESRKTLIFTSTKHMADDLSYRMRRDGYPVSCIHGDKNQTQRDRTMKGQCRSNCSFTSFISLH